jgi:hypothetical protein
MRASLTSPSAIFTAMRRHTADLAFQRAHTRLARVIADDGRKSRVGNFKLSGCEAVIGELAPNEITARNLEFLLLRVARKVHDLHPVAQRPGDRIEHIGGGDEQHARQIEGHREVVVAEAVVLLRVEDFEQRRRGVAVHAGAGLVDLVEHHHAAARTGFFERLDDVARKRADISAAVAADLGLVVHSAQRHARELAPERLGNTLAERGLAHARRADKAQDRPVAVRIELAHRQEFQNAFFYHLQTEMVFAQYAPRLGNIDCAGLGRLPRQLDQPVEVGAYHRIFGRAVRHPLSRLFLARLLFHFFRHLRVGDGFPEIPISAAFPLRLRPVPSGST